MKEVIKVKNLSKSYGNLKALDNLSFDVKEGEIFGLLGPNGSGKTTTINCLLALLNYDSGDISIFGQEMTPTKYEIKEKIGVVFQEVAVFEELTVRENIDYFCSLYIKDKKTRFDYVNDAIALVELTGFTNFKPKQLSGGLLRRLNIACGIAHKPKLIFLDEPTVAVDPQSRNHILEGIKRLNTEGATIIYTSHYMEEVEFLCDNILIVDKGKVIAEGTKQELKKLVGISLKASFEIEKLSSKMLEKVKGFKNIVEVEYKDNDLFVSFEKTNNLGDFINFLHDNKIKYSKVYSELPTLNDVFLELTGKELRD